MTYEQAMAKLEADRQALEQADSDLLTVKALYALGEFDLAMELFAQTRAGLRRSLAR